MTAVDTGVKPAPAAKPVLPYAGPRSLDRGEPIYGRGREIRELRGMVMSERIVLMYSQSGAGKTSLIEAGLRPELEKRRFEVLPTIRVGYQPPTDGRANRYRFSVLLSLEEGRHLENQFAAEELEAMSFKEYLQQRTMENPELDPCLVFDQFEEVFTLDPADWAEKEAFIRELGEALHDRSYFALFAMREDFIAQLDPYRDPMPTRFANRYRLDMLGPEAAKDAIQRPAASAGVDFSEEAADGLVDDLRRIKVQRGAAVSQELGPTVEPVQLQVVCSRLWANLPPDATTIRPIDVAAAGTVNQALADFYADVVRSVVGRTRVKEHVVREWFEDKLISDDGFRTQTREGPGKSGPAALQGLEDAHLIRADRRRGAQWYELTHDRFVEPIRTSNRAFRTRRRRRTARRAIIAAGAVVVALFMALVAGVVLVAVSTAESASSLEELPATLLAGNPDEQTFDLEATGVARFRFDDGVAGEEVFVVVNSTPAADVELRLMRIGTGAGDEDLELGETRFVPPSGSAGSDEATSDSSGDPSVGEQRLDVLAEPSGTISAQFLLPAAGSYIVEVTAKSDAGFTPLYQNESDAGFTLLYEKQSGSPIPALLSGETVEGNLASPGEVGRFVFDGESGDQVTLKLDPLDSLDAVLVLRNQDGMQLQSADTSTGGVRELIVEVLASSGTYSVEVTGLGSIGNYELTLDTVEIEEIQPSEPQSGSILERSDVDVFSFEVFPGEILAFAVEPSADLDPIIEVIDPDGFRQVRNFGSIGEAERLVVNSIDGSHLITITGFIGSTGDYRLILDLPPLTEIPVGESASGLAQPGDPTLYGFTGFVGETYAVVDNPTQDLFFEVVAPRAFPVVTGTFVAWVDGAYVIVVDSAIETPFELSVIRPEVPEILFGETQPVNVERPGPSAAFRFDAVAEDPYSITLTPVQGDLEPWLVVTAPDGLIESSQAAAGPGEALTLTGVTSIDGTYLISWEDVLPTGDYELSLDR